MKKREKLKRDLILDRRIMYDGCEGRKFKEHLCSGAFHMHESIFTRKHIMHLTAKKKEYFWDGRNCVILCSVFHEKIGHTRDFKEWWLKYAERYGDVQAFIDNAPLKVKV